MTVFKELLARKAELDRQINALGREQRAPAIAEIKALMADHGLTLADLTGQTPTSGKKSATKGPKAEAKYRDPDSGATWVGRGPRPRWLKAAIEGGKTLKDLAV